MEKTILKKGMSDFLLTGEAKINQYTFTIDEESDSGFVYNKLNIGIDCGNGNIVYSEMMGGQNPEKLYPIYVHGKNSEGKDDFKNQFTIAWEDRFNEKLLSDVGENCFIRVALERDINKKLVIEKFLSSYDAIAFINENLVDGSVVTIKGKIEYQPYAGSIVTRKKITGFFLSTATPEKYQAKFYQTILYNANALSKKINEEKNSLDLYVNVVDYIGKIDGEDIKTNFAIPKTFEIDLNKWDSTILNWFNKKYLKIEKGWYATLVVEGELREGVSLTTHNVEDYDEDIQALIKMGLFTEEEAEAKFAINGAREKRMVIERPYIVKKTNDEVSILKDMFVDKAYKESEMVFLNSIIDDDGNLIDGAINETQTKPSNKSKPTNKPINTTVKEETIENSLEENNDEDEIDIDKLFAGLEN